MNATIRAMGGMLVRALEVVMWATVIAAVACVALCVLALGVVMLMTAVVAGAIVMGCVHIVGQGSE